MSIKGFYLLPHPPIVVPEVGGEEVKKIQDTYDSMKTVAKDIKEKAPETIILVTPHGSMFRDAISILDGDSVRGDLSRFSASEVSIEKKINSDLTDKIYQLAVENDISVMKSNKSTLKSYSASFDLDHGALVPLYFVEKEYKDYNLVHITYAPLEDDKLYEFGKIIKKAAKDFNTVLIASGDLSHRLKESGPYSYSPAGAKFDRDILQFLKSGDENSILNMDKDLIEDAGECGMRSILILIGALDNQEFQGKLLSYEGSFGVGYGVMILEAEESRDSTNPYTKLARDNLTYFLNTGYSLQEIPDYVTKEMKTQRKGVFVTLYKDGNLRGCIGTIFPTQDSIYEEILRNSIEAGLHDPRFKAVKEDELKDIHFSVDILDSPEPAKIEDLDPNKYGVILNSKGKRALLLPNIEGVDTVEKQLRITKRKGSIGPDEDFTIERFRVTRYEEGKYED